MFVFSLSLGQTWFNNTDAKNANVKNTMHYYFWYLAECFKLGHRHHFWDIVDVIYKKTYYLGYSNPDKVTDLIYAIINKASHGMEKV